MEAALESLKSLKLGEKPNYSKVAKKYGVERSLLSKRHRGKVVTLEEKVNNSRLLNDTQELELVRYIEKLSLRGLPPTRRMIGNFASEIAGKEPGKNWVDRFITRHNINLVSQWATGKDTQRHRADSAFKYSLYFKLLEEKITQYDVEPCNTYDMDEKGFLIGILSRMKRIFTRHLYELGRIKQTIQDGNREWITIIACICADGTALTPALIYQAVSGNIQDTWLQDFDPKQHKAHFTSSPSGWTNNEIGLAWLQQVFDKETKAKARRSWRLLILDGHGSHISMGFLDYCEKNRILVSLFPPHSTHTLQPLDVSMFKPLSTAYSNELAQFMYNCQGLSAITKRDFFQLFNSAWTTAFKKSTIEAAFKATGIYPFDPEAVLKRFKTTTTLRPSSSESSTSVLSASDWRKIERLLREVVEDTHNKQSQLLSQTIHTISVQKQILEHENIRLKEALINEKKCRQRGKPLLLQQPEEYHGGAVFYSPSKIQAARVLQEKDEEIERQKQQKTEQAILREEQKKQKAELLEERKRQRPIAKEIRVQEKINEAKKREEKRIARQAEQQLQKDIQLSKKGNQQRRKASQPHPQVSEDIQVVGVAESLVVDEESVPRRSTRTRKINPPERYRT